jgi:predicted metal-dependent phosphoesterase TrpH
MKSMEDVMGKADTHVHCNYSGFNHLGILKFPESVISAETQVDDARRRGLYVLDITDHNDTAGAFIAQKYAKKFDDIEVIVGDEIMTDQGEVIGLWLTETPKMFMSPEETVDVIHEQGGIAIAPHPFSVHVDGMQEKIFDLPIEGFEVMNGGHPDRYSNWFAQRVMDAYPGRWAPMAGSDAHSLWTAGCCWTEFPGTTAEEFRQAILHKKTVPMGGPATVLGQVQWSMEVVKGGQELAREALRRELEPVPGNRLIEKILSNSDIKNALSIYGGYAYRFPYVPVLATLLSVTYLDIHARRARRKADERFAAIEEKLAGMGILRE